MVDGFLFFARFMVIGALVTPLSGCSSFHRDFKALDTTADATDDILGRWEGTWISDQNGHHGILRCIVEPHPEKSGRYLARFRATFARFMSFQYHLEMTTERRKDVVHFKSKADLGWLAGGVYKYEGQATATEWRSTYRSKKDHGRFEMNRP